MTSHIGADTVLAAAAPAIADRVTEHYERRGREVWGLARRLGATEEQAADVVQEAHLRLFRELSDGAVIDDLSAWTFRVAYRLVMDQHRVVRRVRELVDRLSPSRVESVSHELVDRLSIWPIVDRLPARERATLYLRYRADLSFDQVGEVMGITPASARAYASRAIERLRAWTPELTGAIDG